MCSIQRAFTNWLMVKCVQNASFSHNIFRSSVSFASLIKIEIIIIIQRWKINKHHKSAVAAVILVCTMFDKQKKVTVTAKKIASLYENIMTSINERRTSSIAFVNWWLERFYFSLVDRFALTIQIRTHTHMPVWPFCIVLLS